MEQNKEFRNRPTQAYPGIFKKAAKNNSMEEEELFHQMVLESFGVQRQTKQNTTKHKQKNTTKTKTQPLTQVL